SAETLHVRIPFGFLAAGTTMPAGPYAIRSIPNTTPLLLFENEETKEKILVFARIASPPLEPAAPLKFAFGTGESRDLTKIVTGTLTYELSINPAGGSVKGGLQLASRSK